MRPVRRSVVVVLLMLVMMLSIVDKTIFAFAGPDIIDELQLSPVTFGLIGSSFYCLYSISGVLVGFLANRMPTRWILVAMAIVWMASQVLTGLSQTLVTLVIGRLLLGAGTGPATAVTQHACFKWFDAQNRVVPSSLIQVAIMLGALAGGIGLPLAIKWVGWRGAYFLLAGASVIWMAAWMVFGAEGNRGAAVAHAPHREGDYRRLLLNRTYVWITLLGFLGYLPNALAYSWIPVYMQKGYGLTPLENGYLAVVATSLILGVNIVVSLLARRAALRGASLQSTMVAIPMAASILAGLAYLVLVLHSGSRASSIAIYCMGGVLINILPTFSNAIVAHIAPPQKRGSMLAIHLGVSTSAGILAPWLVGQMVAHFNGNIVRGFETSLAGFGIAIVVAGVIGLRMVQPEKTRQRLASDEQHSAYPLRAASM